MNKNHISACTFFHSQYRNLLRTGLKCFMRRAGLPSCSLKVLGVCWEPTNPSCGPCTFVWAGVGRALKTQGWAWCEHWGSAASPEQRYLPGSLMISLWKELPPVLQQPLIADTPPEISQEGCGSLARAGSSRAQQVLPLGRVGQGRGKVWSAAGTKPFPGEGLRKNRGCFQGASSFWSFFVLCPSDWRSVEVKDWNRRLKICGIFRALKFLDLLAHKRALVEWSDLSSLFRACQEAEGAERFHGNYWLTSYLSLISRL